ncbi:hypothetical protein ACWEK5_42150 [Rhodococcus koreensis]
MLPVECRRCGNAVLVEKYSEAHTSVQWLGDAEQTCPEFALRAQEGEHSMFVPTCSALRGSIDDAVEDGRVGLSLRSYPTPGRLD